MCRRGKDNHMRYVILLVFALANFVNGMFWITFTPIRSLTVESFHLRKRSGGHLVDALSVCYLVLYIPGSIISLYMFSRLDFRRGFVFATLITALGGALRYLASLLTSESHTQYWLLLTGQSLAALVQPFLTNTPAKVAARWFPIEQLDVATAVASLCNPVGIIIGTVLSSTMVTRGDNDDDEEKQVTGMSSLMLIQWILSMMSFVTAIWFFPNRPEILPSEAVKLQLSLLENQENYKGRLQDVASRIWSQVRNCFSHRQFIILLFVFSVGIGVFNTLMTVVEEFIQPLCPKNSESDASTLTATFLLSGMLMTMGTSIYLDRTKKHAAVLKFGAIVSLIALIGMGACLWLRRSQVELLICFGLFGIALVPMLPTAMQAAAEVTYPVTEDVSSMILQAFGQSLGVLLIFIVSEVLDHEKRRDCENEDDPKQVELSSIVFILCAGLGAIAVCFLKIDSKRGAVGNEAERLLQGAGNSEAGTGQA